MINWPLGGLITVAAGGTATIQADLTGPVPVTIAELRINGKPYLRFTGGDLRGPGNPDPVTFSWPVGPSGRYAINLYAADARGCSDTTGRVRTVVVP